MKSIFHLLLFTLNLSLIACSGTGTGNPATDSGLGIISGKLTTSSVAGVTGTPAPSATVRVYSGNSLVSSTTTNTSGDYSVSLSTGEYIVEFEASGARKRRRDVSVANGETVTVDGNLLSRPAEVVGIGVGNLILFAGSDYTTGVVDGYNVTTEELFNANLSEARRYIATATIGTSAYFVGGFKNPGVTATVDIYNSDTNTWSAKSLLTARQVDQVSVIGTKLIVAGGFSPSSSNALNSVEIIDTTSWNISTKSLSIGRHWSATVTAGTKAYFIGGAGCWTMPACASNTIDIYDSVADSISTITMPRIRHHHKAVVVGSKIYIGGGFDETNSALTIVDILETSDNSWTTTTVTTPPGSATIAGKLGDKIFFAGGNSDSNPYSDVVSIFNTSTGVWTERYLSLGRYNIGLAIANEKAYLAGGSPSSGGNTDLIEVLDASEPSVSIFSTLWF